jgi:CRP-like cAMP-binding protein
MSNFFSYGSADAGSDAADADSAASAAIGASFSGDEWDHVLRFAARRRFAPGAVLLKAGDSDRALNVVASGQVELRGLDRKRTLLRSEGEAFGVLSFLDGAPSAVTVSVAGSAPAEVVRLTPEALQQLAAWQPLLAIRLWQEMGAQVASRLRKLQAAD